MTSHDAQPPQREAAAQQAPRANRLAAETSPYLLQHAHNPVDWYPWGTDALGRARELDRPIFLSIGYAACHWCHVMERESFEDEATAADLNRDFVSIKVDREERPDLDAIYMDAVQAMTGQGGWPMSVFLTPDGRPFYGGTYFPNEPRHGMPSFRQLLGRIVATWKEQRDEVESTATRLAGHIREGQDMPAKLLEAIAGKPRQEPEMTLRAATAALASSFDARHGGWGGAPKFPQSMTIEYLLREHIRRDDQQARLMAQRTLDAMADGGIYDHLGGGFARYATDAVWLVPHFEKMLYDNAQLARVYLHAWRVAGEERYAEVAVETLDFVARELRHPPGGAFASSLDADTGGVEGATYVWDAGEVRGLLGRDAAIFEAAYGVTERGNWEGRTILTRSRDLTSLAADLGRPREEIEAVLRRARERLLEARQERPQPGRDDKVLTSWNGLMIAAFAEAGRATRARAVHEAEEGPPEGPLDEEQATRYTRIAAEAADFILGELRTPEGRLRRSWKDGRAQHDGVLEDHAHLADGLLALYESTFDERYFSAARELADLILAHFRAADGGFNDTADDAEVLIARPRSLQDNALPSGGAMATLVLLRLAALTGEGRYREAAEAALVPIVPLAAQHPTAFAQWLQAYQLASHPIDEVAIVGDPRAADTRALLGTVDERFRPYQVLALSAAPAESAVPLLQGRGPVDGRATAYVCRDFACRLPVSDPSALRAQLGGSTAA